LFNGIYVLKAENEISGFKNHTYNPCTSTHQRF
jgi:hypothetical protein